MAATAESFDLLLQRLGQGGEAAVGYERLRVRLVAFFRVRLPAQADALADEVLDRLARRLAEGTIVDKLPGYALGIARLVLLEACSRQQKLHRAATESMRDFVGQSEAEPDPLLPILQNCLQSLGTDSAALILEYYGADAGAKLIERRQQLAERSGVSLNALRNRALRIRLSLEKCVGLHLQHRDEMTKSHTLGMLNEHTAQ